MMQTPRTPGLPVKRRSQKERRRESEAGLLKAAVRVVATRGVSAATFEAIGEAAGYHRSLVSQRFGSKAGLIDAIVADVSVSFDAPFADSGSQGCSGLEALMSYMDKFMSELSASEESRAYFMLLADAASELSELRAAFAKEHARVKAMLADIVRRGQGDGSIAAEVEPEMSALWVGSLQIGIAIQMLVDPATSPNKMRRSVLATLRRCFAR